MPRTAAESFLIPCVVCLVLTSSSSVASEPIYEGRTLTEWLSDFDFGRWQDKTTIAKNEAAECAVEAIGAAGLPVLLERIDTNSPASLRLVEQVEGLRDQGSPRTQEKYDEEMKLIGPSLMGDIETGAAFEILGSSAAPAIPRLIELLTPALYGDEFTQGAAPELAKRKSHLAAECLAAIGPEAVPPLIEALQSEDVHIRYGAAMAAAYYGYDDRIVHALVDSLIDPDDAVRIQATRSIGTCRAFPRIVVPALAERLRHDSDHSVRFYALQALGRFGPAAQSALPEVLRATRGPSFGVRDDAFKALKKILPVEAPR